MAWAPRYWLRRIWPPRFWPGTPEESEAEVLPPAVAAVWLGPRAAAVVLAGGERQARVEGSAGLVALGPAPAQVTLTGRPSRVVV